MDMERLVRARSGRIKSRRHGAEAVLFTDGSRGEDGRVAGDWAKDSIPTLECVQRI